MTILQGRDKISIKIRGKNNYFLNPSRDKKFVPSSICAPSRDLIIHAR